VVTHSLCIVHPREFPLVVVGTERGEQVGGNTKQCVATTVLKVVNVNQPSVANATAAVAAAAAAASAIAVVVSLSRTPCHPRPAALHGAALQHPPPRSTHRSMERAPRFYHICRPQTTPGPSPPARPAAAFTPSGAP
jgi:hypothetical protein